MLFSPVSGVLKQSREFCKKEEWSALTETAEPNRNEVFVLTGAEQELILNSEVSSQSKTGWLQLSGLQMGSYANKGHFVGNSASNNIGNTSHIHYKIACMLHFSLQELCSDTLSNRLSLAIYLSFLYFHDY